MDYFDILIKKKRTGSGVARTTLEYNVVVCVYIYIETHIYKQYIEFSTAQFQYCQLVINIVEHISQYMP